MARLYANNCSSTLAGSISGSATSLTLATGDGAKFPSPSGGDYFDFTLEQGTTREIARCTARSGDVLTITRAVEAIAGVGAVAQAFTAGAIVAIRTTAASLSGSSPVTPFSYGVVIPSGRYVQVLPFAATIITATAPTLNALQAIPFMLARDCTIDRIGMHINTRDNVNTDAVFRFGIYSPSASTLEPSALVVDGGTASAYNAGGGTGTIEVTISTALTAGLYYLAIVRQGTANTASIRTANTNLNLSVVPGLSSTTLATALSNFNITGYTQASITGALPNPMVPGGTLATNTYPIVMRAA